MNISLVHNASYTLFQTPIGPCGLAWRPDADAKNVAVTHFQLPEATEKLTEQRIAKASKGVKVDVPPKPIAEIVRRVIRHLRGSAQDFRDVPLDLTGIDDFAQSVYRATREIPAGETRTYGEIANAVGQAGAARDVGTALSDNPIPLIIPCHRVVAAGGKPGGFSAHGGLSTKERLLELEGTSPYPPQVIRSEHDFREASAILAERDPKLASCMTLAIPLSESPHESPYATLAEAIISQQLAPSAANAIFGRLKALDSGAVPSPEKLLALSDETLRGVGLSGSKAASLKDLAAKTIEGVVPSIEEIEKLGDGAIVRRLTTIRGIGRWTVEMLLIFHLHRMDVFPVDDYALRKTIGAVYGMPSTPAAKDLAALGDIWRPYRTVASLYLWHYRSPKDAA